MSSLADKYEVRSFVDRKIGKEYLIPLINVFHKMDEINFNKLPRSFVLKAAHGSSWNIVSPNKQKLDIIEEKEISFNLSPNSLFIMAGASQKYFTHSIPKEDTKLPRYSLTFRQHLN